MIIQLKFGFIFCCSHTVFVYKIITMDNWRCKGWDSIDGNDHAYIVYYYDINCSILLIHKNMCTDLKNPIHFLNLSHFIESYIPSTNEWCIYWPYLFWIFQKIRWRCSCCCYTMFYQNHHVMSNTCFYVEWTYHSHDASIQEKNCVSTHEFNYYLNICIYGLKRNVILEIRYRKIF